MKIVESYAKNQMIFVLRMKKYSVVDLRFNQKGEETKIKPYANYELAELGEEVKIIGGFNQLSELHELIEKNNL